MDECKIIITGGGTGGHLYPGIAIAKEFEKKIQCSILFVGTKKGIESSIVPGYGYDLKFVWISGISRGRIIKNLLFPVKMIVSFIQAFLIVKKFKPDAIIGTGGYASWPVLKAGVILNIATFIQEQNIKPGLVTKIMSPGVDVVYMSYKETEKYIKGRAEKIVTGNPTRSNLGKIDRKKSAKYFNLTPNKDTIFIFGGSQGSLFINKLMGKAAPILTLGNSVQILWAAGTKWAESIKDKIENENIRIYPYIENMAAAYGICDVAVCRSGATTIAEITRLGIPALFIPFAAAADNHQKKNAEILCKAGAASMLEEKEADVTSIVTKINLLLKDKKALKDMAQKARGFGMPDAAYTIAKDIVSRIL